MKREDFIKIIKIRSFYKLDKRKGNYKLSSGNFLSEYIENLVREQMELDDLGIMADGNLTFVAGGVWNTETKDFDDYTLVPPFEANEKCSYDRMEKRIRNLVWEIIS